MANCNLTTYRYKEVTLGKYFDNKVCVVILHKVGLIYITI